MSCIRRACPDDLPMPQTFSPMPAPRPAHAPAYFCSRCGIVAAVARRNTGHHNGDLRPSFTLRRHGNHSLRGKARSEAAAPARFAFDLERRLVSQQGLLHDRKSESGAAVLARVVAIDPVETFRQARDVLLFNADAGVFD